MPRFVIINSFDRSGSSFLVKSIVNHPQIECLFQPFNASIFRKEIFDYWDIDYTNIEAFDLMKAILEGDFSKEKIKSYFFHHDTTSFKLEEDKLYVIKTTICHTKLAWLIKNYPEIPIWGLYRNPISIIASLYRNKFIEQWYGDWAFEDIKPKLNKIGLLKNYTNSIDDLERMAFIIGYMNSTMKKDINPTNNIKFEGLITDFNKEISTFINEFNLEKFDFSASLNKNHNIIGKKYEGNEQWKDIFSKNQIERVLNVFKNFDL